MPKIRVGSGGVTADGIMWSSVRWVDQTDEQAQVFRDSLKKLMSAEQVGADTVLMSADAYDTFKDAIKQGRR